MQGYRLHANGTGHGQHAIGLFNPPRLLLQRVFGQLIAGGGDYHPAGYLFTAALEFFFHFQNLGFPAGVAHGGTGAAADDIHFPAFLKVTHYLLSRFLTSNRLHPCPSLLGHPPLVLIMEMLQAIHHRIGGCLPEPA